MINTAIFQPVYGCFPRWPEEGTSWIHPEDVDLAGRLIPSFRIFRRDWRGEEYSRLTYGAQIIRVKPTMWQMVEPGKFGVGDEVEIRSQMGKRLPGLAVIREAFWNKHAGLVQYELKQRDLILPQLFEDQDLVAVEFLHESDLSNSSREEHRIEIPPDSDAPKLMP